MRVLFPKAGRLGVAALLACTLLACTLSACAGDGAPPGAVSDVELRNEPSSLAGQRAERRDAPLRTEVSRALGDALSAAAASAELLEARLPDASAALRAEVAAFYAARAGEPAWVGDGNQRRKAARLLAAACEADSDGLDASAWPLEEARRSLAAAAPEAGLEVLLDAELRLTATLLEFARDLRHGQVTPGRLRWRLGEEPAPAHPLLAAALEEKDAVAALRPPHAAYAKLRAALAALREVEARGGWPEVDAGPKLEEGAEDERVVQVRARLAASGELGANDGSPVFDAALAEALRTFQLRQGLEPDGAVGPATLRALREPVAAQLQRLRVNLERLRWLPAELEGRHVRVNVPGFELEARDGGRRILRSPVVVGVPGWQTPVMRSDVVRLEVNPQWRVPPRITREEVLPNMQEDPAWAARNAMRVIDRQTGAAVDPAEVDWSSAEPGEHRFVQRAGGHNPMGAVKLAMDNRLQIYLHGTSEPEVFERSQRAVSHGCVRVKELDALARFILPEAAHGDYAQALESGAEKWLELEEQVPVYLVYFTAWVDDAGALQQRPDLYAEDRRLARALGEPEPDALACR